MISRRDLLKSGVVATTATQFVPSSAFAGASECSTKEFQLAVESNESPFFEHFHLLLIPIVSLISIPANGIEVRTSKIDLATYDKDTFEKFVKSSGLDSKMLLEHDHGVQISAEKLKKIASGEKNVEIRVISKAGNYVHNFTVTASPMVLARIHRSVK